jgi:glycosyltransferase involved in cell wall biosynthesis
MTSGSRSSRLKCAFFSHLPHLSGAERSLLSLTGDLVRDHDVDCTIVVPGQGPLNQHLQAAGVRVIGTDYHWWCASDEVREPETRHRLHESFERVREEVLPVIEELDPDLITTQTIAIPYGAWVAAELEKPHIWNLREYGESGGLRFFLPFGEVLSFIRETSDFIFGANKTLCTDLMPDLPLNKHDFLYPAIEVPPNTESDPSGLPHRGDGCVLGEFASIMPHKELETGIEAIANIVAKGLSVDLLLVGEQDQDYVEKLERRAAELGVRDRVHIRTFAENVFPTMAAVDAVVVSATVHSLGRTAIEGMLLGKPVIYPLCTGFDDYMENDVTGLGYAAGDPLAMADRIELLINEPELGAKIGAKAKEVANELFTRQGFSGKFFNRACQLIAQPRPDFSRRRRFINELLATAPGE